MRLWRLLDVETHNAFMNMAIDEAILRERIEEKIPNTIRFYRWKPSAVSIGRFQKIEKEVYLENCEKLGVDVIRRISGGGTVYHSQKELTYSVIAKTDDFGTKNIETVYAKVYGGIAEALKILGITSDFNEGNPKKCPNLTVKGKKISGSAQAHKSGVFLQHGTLLLDVDLEEMFTLLRVPWAKSCIEVVKVAERKITSLEVELGRIPSVEEVGHSLTEGFKRAFNVEFAKSRLTSSEFKLAIELSTKKYSTDSWNSHGKKWMD